MSDSTVLTPNSSSLGLIDTHCHIHDSEFTKKYDQSADELLSGAKKAGVERVVCVGTDNKSSLQAAKFAANRENVEASVALHPHEAANLTAEECNSAVHELEVLIQSTTKPIIAVGECGLDYYYHDSEKVKTMQKYLFRLQIELAMKYDLPLIFHVRDAQNRDESDMGQAFQDFFIIIDDYPGVRGIVHSFSAGLKELKGAVDRGLYVGLNGIMTFSKQTSQLNAAKAVPLEKLVLETDAPFLTPEPFRGKMCKPEHLRVTAEFLAKLRGESLKQLAAATTANAKQLLCK